MPRDAYRFTTPRPWDKQPGLWVITTLTMLFSLLVFAGRWTIRRQYKASDITLSIAYVRKMNLWPHTDRALSFDVDIRCYQLGRPVRWPFSWRRNRRRPYRHGGVHLGWKGWPYCPWLPFTIADNDPGRFRK